MLNYMAYHPSTDSKYEF